MIIVKLMGGLGNQMFQYAAARRLAWVSGVPLKLDLGWFQGSLPGTTPREYALGPFNIAGECASASEIARLAPRQGTLGKLLARCLPFGGSYLPERHFHFDPALLAPRKSAYLDGYWQSEKYFCDIRDTICADLTLKEAPQGSNRDLAERLADPALASVSLHIRRGDYVSCPSASSVHGSCSPEYYARAVASLAARVERPHFFIFSDEPEWVPDNFPLDHPCTIVAHNPPEQGHEDLRLMTLCRHHIIANSSFSWWGAWLCRNRDKIVIAPQTWFAGASHDTGDVIPASWTRM
ncbi:alpha-1,2-fucosyltransferase [Geomonas sp. Red69]|uniref:alpha-1,2-fucosyltransferase n=1 Tax=Geomonas diazotrophica TaxID=2843197 RepID=UPI001C1175DA|nr:alpha-1,2-fucosyltransferase [Geomonas diazotrophica]MBU5636450.1 alpha-1,2-fucosyltransferase [Geomonas diazotrophica]